jgi:small subunit ribosomal protein S21
LIKVVVRFNNIEYALKALRKKMQREGIFRKVKKMKFYEKPSTVKKKKEADSKVRRKRKRSIPA